MEIEFTSAAYIKRYLRLQRTACPADDDFKPFLKQGSDKDKQR